MEEILRDWIQRFKKEEIEKDIEAYYRSLRIQEKSEDKEWARMSSKNAEKTWND